MATLITLWAMYGKTFLTVLGIVLPSLIVGLTPYPKAGGVVKFLNIVLQILSIVTPKDAPGTFKLPLKVVKP